MISRLPAPISVARVTLRSRHDISPVATSMAANGAEPKSPFEA